MQLSSGNELLQVNTSADMTTVHCVLTPQFSMHALAVTSEVFRKANARSGQNLYHINLCSFDGEMVSSDSAWPVTAADPPRDLGRGDRILVFAAETSQNYQNPNLLSWLRMQFRRGADIAGIDVGTFILARCGILDGIEATAHWRHLPSLRERFPKIIVTEKMFCSKGRLATSAGGQGTIDLMLNIVSQTHGATLARDVAAALLFHKVNGPDTPQRPRSRTDTNQLPPQIRAAVYLIEETSAAP